MCIISGFFIFDNQFLCPLEPPQKNKTTCQVKDVGDFWGGWGTGVKLVFFFSIISVSFEQACEYFMAQTPYQAVSSSEVLPLAYLNSKAGSHSPL